MDNPEPQEGFESSLERMRALAHPVRIELVERIGRMGQARATDLASDMGQATNAISYHLRVLNRAGIVETVQVPDGDKRNRIWKLHENDFEELNNEIRARRATDPDATAAATDSAAFEWVRTGYLRSLQHQTEAADREALGPWLFPTTVYLNRSEAEWFYRKSYELLLEHKKLNRDANGKNHRDDSATNTTYRVLFAIAPDPQSGAKPT